jgi:hypothetical protein
LLPSEVGPVSRKYETPQSLFSRYGARSVMCPAPWLILVLMALAMSRFVSSPSPATRASSFQVRLLLTYVYRPASM